MAKKLCKKCGCKLHSKGKTAAGTQRYFCPKCKKSEVRKRPDLVLKSRFELHLDWLSGKWTKAGIAAQIGVDRRTLTNWFAPFKENEITPKQVNCSNQIIIVDGYYIEKLTTVLIVQLPDDKVVSWRFVSSETYVSWFELFNQISDYPFAIVGDGQKGMWKAIKKRYPSVIFQRCQFHVVHYVNLKLTKHPESQAAVEFKVITSLIIQVKTRQDLKNWLASLRQWCKLWEHFLKQRTYQKELTPTGQLKWHYTHSNLHAAFSHVKNALPYLFQYIRFPEIPNTSNRIEGSVNALLQRRIDAHRGLQIYQRKQLVSACLLQKQT